MRKYKICGLKRTWKVKVFFFFSLPQVICRAAVLNLYSPEETVNVFALAFLHILVETNVELFLKHFPLHEVSIFRKFMFDKVRVKFSNFLFNHTILIYILASFILFT